MAPYFAELMELFSEVWVTPEVAMNVVFSDIMPETHPERMENSDWCIAYIEVLENLKQRGSNWAALIETMPTWSAYLVAHREMNLARKEKSEHGTGMFFTYWAEALTMFMTSRDIPFEIDEQLVQTDLHLLSLQQKVLLRDHLKATAEFELMGPTEGFSMSASSSSSAKRGRQCRYWAPRRVYVGDLEWPIGAKVCLDAIFGRPSDAWRDSFFG